MLPPSEAQPSVLEQAVIGSASRATMAVVISIFLEPIVVASCWLMDFSLPWSETPMAPPRSAPRSTALPPVVIPAAYLSASRRLPVVV